MNKKIVILFATLFATNICIADKPVYHSKYQGQEKRLIKSLSPDDIEQLSTGKGWGLAKAAELNGMPGPSHILQMKQEIRLTAEQERKVQSLYDEMKREALPLGKKLITLEKDLNDSFATKAINRRSLNDKLVEIEKVRSELRYVHLVTHLQTPDILTKEQVSLYNKLRGYDAGDPCQHIPKGHDAAMWKKHNGCS